MPRTLFDPATDYYGLLGVPSTADSLQIQAAYRRLAKAHHPDVIATRAVDSAEEASLRARAGARMARFNVAKAVLLDPYLRSQYDAARRLRYAHGGGHDAGPRANRAPHTRTTTATWTNNSTRAYASAATRIPQPRVGVHAGVWRPWWRDAQTLMLIGIAFPALCAVLLYLVGGLQLMGSSTPARPAQFDLALTPNNQPTVKNTAQLLFSITAGRAPDVRIARYANDNILASLRDSSPEASVLRAAGRRLYQAGLNHDAAEWAAAVAQICALAGHC